ncbi:MAG: AMP-binding protein [Muribaculum sp.]|nr:AMP-binding protein [Muribaculaceae bacterium]MCM1080940.1 AMP-binding protein [Muribaculum sp.]
MIHDPYNQVSEFINEWNSDVDYIVAYTSGSTGKPKKICLPKRDLIHSAETTCRFFSIQPGENLYLPLSPDYIAGKMMVVRSLISGAHLFVDRPSNNITGCNQRRFKLAAIVPSQVGSFVKNTPDGYCKYLIVGGGRMTEKQRTLLLSRNDITSYATYGMTETSSHVALSLVSSQNPEEIYTALPGVNFTIDCRNCLVINSEYYSFGRLVTNDIVELRSDISFRLIGRADNVINSGGLKICPEEVEQKLSALISAPYYITWRPSAKWGHEVILLIETSATDMPDKDILLNKIRKDLPHHQCPKDIIFMGKFERTESGKIKRIHL